LQKGFEFGLQIRHGSRTIFEQVEQLPLPSRQPSLAKLPLELCVNEAVQLLEPVADRPLRVSVDHELTALPHKLILKYHPYWHIQGT
jgi:hypothetical protein